MKEAVLKFEFTPTVAALKSAHGVAFKVAFTGGWRGLRYLTEALMALGYLLAGVAIFSLVLRAFSLTIGDLGTVGAVLAPASGLVIVGLRFLYRHHWFQYALASGRSGKHVFQAGEAGFEIATGGWQFAAAWDAVETVTLTRRAIAIVVPGHYFAIPLHCFASKAEAGGAVQHMMQWKSKETP